MNVMFYEVNKKQSKIFLFCDEECAGLIGDDYDDFNEFGDFVIDGVMYGEK